MDSLTRSDVAEYNAVSMIVFESELVPPDAFVAVIPLLSGFLAVQHLDPELRHDGRRLVLATRLIATVRRSVVSLLFRFRFRRIARLSAGVDLKDSLGPLACFGHHLLRLP
jgi:toxin CcdB